MFTSQIIQEIDEHFGEGWFNEVNNGNEEIRNLSLEEKVDWVRNCSIHGQTSFFRDSYLLPVLEHVVIPPINRRPVKIASVGCSDGREVYSILLHFWSKRDEFVLHGYDSNIELVKEARAGGTEIPLTSKGFRLNSAYSEKHFKLEGWKRYGAEGIAYTLTPSNYHSWADLTFTEQSRDRLRFNVHNILGNPLPEKYDSIGLLNVLCHYAPKGREKILENINKSLDDRGWLVCESYHSGSANATKEYDMWMKDLSQFGFVKQSTVIPTWASSDDDVSGWTRVYRKV